MNKLLWCVWPALALGASPLYVDPRAAIRYRGLTAKGITPFFELMLQRMSNEENDEFDVSAGVPVMDMSEIQELYMWRALEKEEFGLYAQPIMKEIHEGFLAGEPEHQRAFQEAYARKWTEELDDVDYEDQASIDGIIQSYTAVAYEFLSIMPEEYFAANLRQSPLPGRDVLVLNSLYDFVVAHSLSSDSFPNLAWPWLDTEWTGRRLWEMDMLRSVWFDKEHGPIMLEWYAMSMVEFVLKARPVIVKVHEKYMTTKQRGRYEYIQRHKDFLNRYGEERVIIGYAKTLYGMLGCITPTAIQNRMNFELTDTSLFTDFDHQEGDYIF